MNGNLVYKSFLAHAYGQCVTLIATILIPSFAIDSWGLEGVGYWMSFLAFSLFFQITDLGKSIALGNQLSLNLSRNSSEARKLVLIWFKRNLRSIIIATLINFTIGFLFAMHLKDNNNENYVMLAGTLVVLNLSSCLYPFFSVYGAIWRFVGKNEVGVFANNTIRLMELMIFLWVLKSQHNMLMAALSILTFKVVVIVFIFVNLKNNKYFEGLICNTNVKSLRIIEDNWAQIKKAGIGFSGIWVAQQLMQNAPVVLVGIYYGAIEAAVFSMCRTLSRLPSQPIIMFYSSMGPRLTDLIAQNRNISELIKKMLIIVLVFSVLIEIIIYLFNSQIVELWLSNRIVLKDAVLIPLCLSTVFYSIGQLFTMVLSSANKTKSQSSDYMIASVLGAISIYFVSVKEMPVHFVAMIIMSIDLLIAVLLAYRLKLENNKVYS